jgi:hypothetical protein
MQRCGQKDKHEQGLFRARRAPDCRPCDANTQSHGDANDLGLSDAWHAARVINVSDGSNEILYRTIAQRPRKSESYRSAHNSKIISRPGGRKHLETPSRLMHRSSRFHPRTGARSRQAPLKGPSLFPADLADGPVRVAGLVKESSLSPGSSRPLVD